MSDETECAVGETVKKGYISGFRKVVWDFDYASMGQETTRSCWYASLRIVFKWANVQGKGKSPDDVKPLVLAGAFGGDTAKWDNAIKFGLEKEDRAAVFSALGMDAIDRAEAKKWDVDSIMNRLNSSGPIVITKAVTADDGSFTTHAMVIRGFDMDDHNNCYVIEVYDEAALTRQSGPYNTSAINWSLDVFLSTLPKDGSISAKTALAWLR